ncbi:MAG: hypothetical protein WD894_12985 [Pirellulales bacterium]
MHVRFAIAVLVLTGIALPGCSLPRGPINIDPLLPRWLAHGEVSSDCPPELLSYEGGAIDPASIQPPVSKFHPVPTRPVFETASAPPATEL